MIPCYIQKKTKTLIKNKGPYIIMEIYKVRNKRTNQIMYLPRFDAVGNSNYKIISIVKKTPKNYRL